MKLVTVYGSPTPPGKLARALTLLEEGVRSRHPEWIAERVSPQPGETFVAAVWDQRAVEAVGDADAVVLATPVFRGSMTAALKLLIDMLPNEALRSKPTGILTVAAAPEHFLSAERHLRDVLTWFGALTSPNSAFFVDKVFADNDVDPDVSRELRDFADQLITLAERVDGHDFGPDPLTARYVKKTAR